jgi:magnesium transporter
MTEVLQLGADGVLRSGSLELLAPAVASGLAWIDVQDPTEDSLAPLAAQFGLHPLAIEDCLHLDQRPKLEEFSDHQFLVIHSFREHDGDVTRVTLNELHLFLGKNWLISVHEGPCDAVSAIWQRVKTDPQPHLGRGVDFLTYLLADALIDQNFPILDRFSDQLEELELQIFEAPTKQHLQRAFAMRRTLVHMRRVLSPQRDVMGLLARRGVAHVGETTALYFRDVYDHLVRLYEHIDSTKDLLGNALEAYLSVMANRTGDVTKQLTIFATLFLPLSFIVGFFGQNFEVLSGKGFFGLMLGTIVALPIAMILWFRSRDWI